MKQKKLLAALSLTLASLAAALPAIAQTPASAPPSVTEFFQNPEFSGAVISPSGKFLAALVPDKNGRKVLSVVDLAAKTSKMVASFTNADIDNVHWISDQRLVFDARDRERENPLYLSGPGLYAVDRDGGRYRQLVDHALLHLERKTRAKSMLSRDYILLEQLGNQDSDWIYVEQMQEVSAGQYGHTRLWRLNTLDGQLESVSRPGDVQRWMLDEKGLPRLASVTADGRSTTYIRDDKQDKWRELASTAAFGTAGIFRPLGFGPDGTLYVVASQGDHAALFSMDVASGKLADKPWLQLDGFDFTGRLLTSGGKVAGVRYIRDGEGTQWFDPAMQALQTAIDARLPNTTNLVEVPAHPDAPFVLVRSYSDTQPSMYLAYHKETRQLELVGQTYPSMKQAQMGVQAHLHYPARDGLAIPALLTLPQVDNGKKPPLVVMVHDGPYERGASWGWKPEIQFLASRGFAVLEPDYRGSAGYGNKHFQASFKQWGLKMQDDIADGVKWAAAQGYVDGRRVCIMGSGYGGYAALMGLVNDPGLYQCGIARSALPDLDQLYGQRWYRAGIASEWKNYGMPQLVGERDKDAAQLKATSPLHQAARITQPLLLVHGALNPLVPIGNATALRDALKPHNKLLEWVEYEREGLGSLLHMAPDMVDYERESRRWVSPNNRIDYWNRVEKFLDKHIGNGAR